MKGGILKREGVCNGSSMAGGGGYHCLKIKLNSLM